MELAGYKRMLSRMLKPIFIVLFGASPENIHLWLLSHLKHGIHEP